MVLWRLKTGVNVVYRSLGLFRYVLPLITWPDQAWPLARGSGTSPAGSPAWHRSRQPRGRDWARIGGGVGWGGSAGGGESGQALGWGGLLHSWPHLAAIALNGDQVAPLLDRLGQVNLTQWDLHLTDLVVFGEPIEVVDAEHQRLGHDVGVGDLLGEGQTAG